MIMSRCALELRHGMDIIWKELYCNKLLEGSVGTAKLLAK